MLCDQGSSLASYGFAKWCIDRKISQLIIAPHSHKSNGLNERINQTLIGRLRRMLLDEGHLDWSRTLAAAVDVMNETTHDITDFAPTELWNGNQAMWNAARDHMTKSREKMNKRLEKSRVYRNYQPGQAVWVYDFVRAKRLDKKFTPFWIRPWTLLDRKSRVIWTARTHRGQTKLVHSDSLQPYVTQE